MSDDIRDIFNTERKSSVRLSEEVIFNVKPFQIISPFSSDVHRSQEISFSMTHAFMNSNKIDRLPVIETGIGNFKYLYY